VSVSQVNRDIGVSANQMFRWRRALEGSGKAFPGSGGRGQELLALKCELAKVKREQDLLMGAEALFARESK